MASRLSGRQITTLVVAICIAVVAFPVGVYATTGNSINITDPVYTSRKARVDGSGRLSVTDGGGSLTVDGAVNARPIAPAGAWSAMVQGLGQRKRVLGPTASMIDVSSVTVSIEDAGNSVGSYIELEAYTVADTATDCASGLFAKALWAVYILPSSPVSAPFATPIRYGAPSGKKACLMVLLGSATQDFRTLVVSANGYVG
jgi:hypothetical protein